jgi:TolA-binding protein
MSGFVMRKSLLTSAVFSTALFLMPVAVWAQPMVQSQEGIALQNEIDQLQAQVQQLQGGSNSGGSALGGGSAPPPAPAPSSGDGTPVAGGVVAGLLTQMQQLQSQVQALNGKVDELQNQVDTQNAQTQKQIGDLNFKVTGSATPGTPPAPGMAPPPGAPASGPQALTPPPAAPAVAPAATATMSGDPKSQLHAAVAAYGQKNYTTSAALAAALVKSSPQAPEAYRAQYLVVQSYSAYDNTYNMNRTGTYAPQSLLGLASSLASIGANDEACSTLSSLNSQFPTPPAGLQPRIDAVSKQASCK